MASNDSIEGEEKGRWTLTLYWDVEGCAESTFHQIWFANYDSAANAALEKMSEAKPPWAGAKLLRAKLSRADGKLTVYLPT